jgi:hypothetical protein
LPIRFQVDPDFYDHPKTIGMSDGATALWVRAGSYSAAKLTDGFIAEHVLSLLSRCPEEAANELVGRGLWKRVKGGYRFHQWSLRNLSRARVEAEKEADRLRKRQERHDARQNGKPQARPPIVRPDSGPDSDRTPEGIRPLSVSVSVSESVSGSGRDSPPVADGTAPGGPEPPTQCSKHLDDPDPPPCGACGVARRAHDAWALAAPLERARADQAARHQRAVQRAETTRLAIAACRDCDEAGYLPGGSVCPHDPNAADRAARGAAAARAALATTTSPGGTDG